MLRAFFVALALLIAIPAHAAQDPRLKWKTLETKHFRITFYGDEEPVARHIAGMAEGIYQRLVPVMAYEPKEITELALSDFTDSANADGVRVGAGAEYAIGPNSYVKAEYRYSNYEGGFERHQALAGFGFRF